MENSESTPLEENSIDAEIRTEIDLIAERIENMRKILGRKK
jgi:hypothetical protein